MIALIMDRFRSHIKPTLYILILISSTCFIWLTLLTYEVLPFSLAQMYLSTILATSASFCGIPLSFELALMISYPANEGLVGAFLAGVYNGVGLVFLLLLTLPNIGTKWMILTLTTAKILALPALMAVGKPKDYIEKAKEKDDKMQWA